MMNTNLKALNLRLIQMTYLRFSRFYISIIAFFGVGLTLFGCQLYAFSEKEINGENLAVISARLTPDLAFSGEQIQLKIQLKIEDGWSIYALKRIDEDAPPPTSLRVLSEDLILDGTPYETPPKKKIEQSIGLDLLYHDGKVTFYQHLSIPKQLKTGMYELGYVLKFQLCSKTLCLPTITRTESIRFAIKSGVPRSKYQNLQKKVFATPSKTSVKILLKDGVWAFIGLAVLMGVASLITPCVFPMIPLTISFFSKNSSGDTWKTLKLATMFAGGIILTYTGGGLLLTVIFGAGTVQQVAANPFINGALAFIFILFGLSLFGLFEIRFPNALANYLDHKARRMGGGLGIFLMGVTFTITAFTCTVQFIGTLLVAAAGGEWGWPLLGMLVYSTVFATPFFILAIVPALSGYTRKASGDSLKLIRQILGLIELLIAIKFLSNADLVLETNLLSRNGAIWLWCAILAVGGLYLLWTQLRKKGVSVVQWGLVFCVGVMLSGALYGTQGNSLGGVIDSILPPMQVKQERSKEIVSLKTYQNLKWFSRISDAKVAAATNYKPLLIYFTGKTCVNCRWMEQNIFRQKEVYKRLSESFNLVRLYTDSGTDAEVNLQYQINQFGTVSLPLYVRMDQDEPSVKLLSGIVYEPKEFIAFLERG